MRTTLVRGLDWTGNTLLVVAFAIIALGYIAIAATQGIGAMLNMLNPFNVINVLAILLTLSPGIALKALAQRLRRDA